MAELKGIAATIPNEIILVNRLTLQEAKDSSAVENIITTHDELFKAELFSDQMPSSTVMPAAKEVQDYATALKLGFEKVKTKRLLCLNDITEIQTSLEKNKAGLRKLLGTELKNLQTGDIVYSPPQNADEISRLMDNLVSYMNDDSLSELDQLPKIYSQDLINNLFKHPYTKIDFMINDLRVSRITATQYLDQLTEQGCLQKKKIGRSNDYINKPLCKLFIENSS